MAPYRNTTERLGSRRLAADVTGEEWLEVVRNVRTESRDASDYVEPLVTRPAQSAGAQPPSKNCQTFRAKHAK